MNGPQHYREAEGFLQTAEYFKQEGDQATSGYALRRALIHATLAQAAATAEHLEDEAWAEVFKP